MKGHAWWLIAKVSDIVGGGGYWRAKLIDEFVNHFSEWWFNGTSYTAHWSPTGVGLPLYPDYMDITNQFVAEGVSGGIVRFILYIWLIVTCFRRVGGVAKDELYPEYVQLQFWSIGSMIFAYCMSFLAVANSAQNTVIFFCAVASLAMIPEKEVSRVTLESPENDDGMPREVSLGLDAGQSRI